MRPLILAALLLALPVCSLAADAPAPFPAQQRLAELQQRYTLNRERAAALDMAASEMQRAAEALEEIVRLQAEAGKGDAPALPPGGAE